MGFWGWVSLFGFLLAAYPMGRVNALTLSDCVTRTMDTCQYQFCQAKFQSYSNPVLMLLPVKYFFSAPIQARVHFHGFSQKPDGSPYHENYDVGLDVQGRPLKSFEQMMNNYGMSQSACRENPQVLVMPIAYYKVDQYKSELTTIARLDSFFSEIENFLESFSENTWVARSLTVSAHSAGGDWLMQILSQDATIAAHAKFSQLILYDGIYSREAADALKMIAVKGLVPNVDVISVHTKENTVRTMNQVRDVLRAQVVRGSTLIGTSRFHQDSIQGKAVFRHFYETTTPAPAAHDHWSIVKAGWVVR